MAFYTLSARFARFENGEYVEYPIGTPVDLSLEEVEIWTPGVATLSSNQKEAIVRDTSTYEPRSELELESKPKDDSKPVFRTTLAKKKVNEKGEEVSDVSGSKYCEGEPGTVK